MAVWGYDERHFQLVPIFIIKCHTAVIEFKHVPAAEIYVYEAAVGPAQVVIHRYLPILESLCPGYIEISAMVPELFCDIIGVELHYDIVGFGLHGEVYLTVERTAQRG